VPPRAYKVRVTERARNTQSSRQRSNRALRSTRELDALNETATLRDRRVPQANFSRWPQRRPLPSPTEWLRGEGASIMRDLRCYHNIGRAAFESGAPTCTIRGAPQGYASLFLVPRAESLGGCDEQTMLF